jgi:homoserine dehydrogenase
MPALPPVTIDLVLVGFGHVGRAFVRLLADRQERLRRDHGLVARTIGIATARHGCAIDIAGLDTLRAAAMVESGGRIDELHAGGSPPRTAREVIEAAAAARGTAGPMAMVETTRLDVHRGEPAATHVRLALAAGAHVVTANKGPVACAYRELADLAARAGRQFLFEGAVMDGIPVFNLVRETLPAISVTRLRGIVNTTTNYLIAAMEAGRDIAEALPEMQARGIAEADASLDVDGWDAAAKAAALGNVLLDASLTPAAVERTGIGHLTSEAVRDVRRRGRRLKLVASVWRDGAGVRARVAPEALDPDDLLAGIHGTMNALTIGTDRLGDITIVQHGGGLVETAYALLGDLVTLRRRLS